MLASVNEARQFPRITLYMLRLKLREETVTFQRRLESDFLGIKFVECLGCFQSQLGRRHLAGNRKEEVIVRRRMS